MTVRLRQGLDPFLLALIGVVALASLLPARGAWASIAGMIANAGIVLLFFLHGAKLSRRALLDGARSWRLHLATLGVTFIFFPLLGLVVGLIPGVPALVATGVLFLTLVPSTVQSSIAFTSIARGNVAAALVSASFSNLLGIFLTPLLAALLITSMAGAGGAQGGVSFHAVEAIALHILAPFVAGHLARPRLAGFIATHNALVSSVDRGSILIVVYTAFSAAVVEGLWRRISATEFVLILGLCVAILLVALAFTWTLGRALGLSRADAIALQFCGSKKSLASGVPMAGALFPAATVGVVILPLMIFHQIQLIACALLARHYGARTPQEGAAITTNTVMSDAVRTR